MVSMVPSLSVGSKLLSLGFGRMPAICKGPAGCYSISSFLIVDRLRCADETDHSLSSREFRSCEYGCTKLQVKEEVESPQVITAHELVKITRHKRH